MPDKQVQMIVICPYSSSNSRKRVKFACRYGPLFFNAVIFARIASPAALAGCRPEFPCMTAAPPCSLASFFSRFTCRVLTPSFKAACLTVYAPSAALFMTAGRASSFLLIVYLILLIYPRG
jgi:hypothetical protein